MNHWKFRGAMLVAAASLLLCSCSPGQSASPTAAGTPPAAAATAQPQPAPPAATTATAAPAGKPQSAQLEFIDPATGQHREPTAAERAALQPPRQATAAGAASDTPARSAEIVLPNGVVAVKAGQMSQMNGCLQKDGRVAVDHDCKSDVPAAVKKP